MYLGVTIVSLLLSALGLQNMVARNLNLVFLIYLHTLVPILIASFFIMRPETLGYAKFFNKIFAR